VKLKGRQKAAAYLLGLDTQTAAGILKNFEQDEIATVTQEMLNLKSLDGETIEDVRRELHALVTSGKSLGIADPSSVVGKLLEATLGAEKGREMLDVGSKPPRRPPFESLNELESAQLIRLLNGEHPQLVAVVLAHLKPQLSAAVLSALPEDVHADIVTRMTKLEAISNSLLDDIEILMCQKVDRSEGQATATAGASRYKAVAEMLNMVGKTVRKNVLDRLSQADPQSAQEIENLMFVFEDLATVDNRSIQKILREVDNQSLALALKAASDAIKNKVFSNLSKRAVASMQEELEMLGPKPISEVEAAQRELLEVARRLDEAGEITLRQSDQEELV
jgi:flagellar motor switch protein FliG